MLHMKHFRVVSYRRRITILAAYDKGFPVKFMVFCRQAISESPGLRTMYMISVFIGVYMLCCT